MIVSAIAKLLIAISIIRIASLITTFATVAMVTPRIPGTISEITIQENWHVERGELLVRLDPTEYEVRLEEADAALAQAQQMVAEHRAQVRAAESTVGLSEAELEQLTPPPQPEPAPEPALAPAPPQPDPAQPQAGAENA